MPTLKGFVWNSAKNFMKKKITLIGALILS